MWRLIEKLLSLLFPYRRPTLYHSGLALHIRDAAGRSALSS